ncbi:hypothetical protein [Amycolatopsis panacis]|uniref:Uncharacterized protein n=1 Tax=Amycolatopsis panacis TaxID=2340917 RepID=A0A419IBR1_9PSEU|nr:hypothetical protein [Amycolatopsis panacis]RJQ92737.1 hypothetical protein D5S19_00255 [Amycolatopsis panacis]
MAPEKRAAEIADTEASVAEWQSRVEQLRQRVGDPETVMDQNGRLPARRRELNLVGFSCQRQNEVRRLRALIADLRAKLKASTDRSERSELRNRIACENHTRVAWEAIPKLDAADMCSECDTPSNWHEISYTMILPEGPCFAWPRRAERMREARERFLELANKPRTPELPKAKPLAVIPSGLPLNQIVAKLAELQAKHPNAIVRRGNANKWELWPPRSTTSHEPAR